MKLLSILCFVLFASPALADLLPPGIGGYQLGYRLLSDKDMVYDANGRRTSIADKYRLDLSGETLLSGAAGDDLKLLADELDKYDVEGSSTDSVVDQLTLGEYEIKSSVAVDSMFLGFAYGIKKNWNVFFGIPWVRAHVDLTMETVRANNADDISARLGDLAFDELAAGLRTASEVDQEELLGRLSSDYGYEPLEAWEYEGFGDAVVGVRHEQSFAMRRAWAFVWGQESSLTLPTGYVDDPDRLQDTDIGGGAYALNYGTQAKWQWRRMAHMGVYGSYDYAMAQEKSVRVPEGDEALVDQDRKANVTFKRGDQVDIGTTFGGGYRFLQAGVDVGQVRGFGDRYRGSLSGNYEALSDGSDTELTYDRWHLALDSTRAYRHGRFAIPAILRLSTQVTRQGRNRSPETYYQLDLTSFFR